MHVVARKTVSISIVVGSEYNARRGTVVARESKTVSISINEVRVSVLKETRSAVY